MSLHPQPPRLARPVQPVAPLEESGQRQRHPQHRARDRLRRHLHLQLRQVRELGLEQRRLPLVGDELAQLAHAHVLQRVEPRPLPLELGVDVLRLIND